MELFLNILWLVLALVGLGLWRMRWAGQPRENVHAPWRQWTAFVCALILLFFMVSLTDDLHSELVVYEESSASRRHAACVACPHQPPPVHSARTAHAVLNQPRCPSNHFWQVGSVSAGVDFRLADPSLIFPAGRAPPDFSL